MCYALNCCFAPLPAVVILGAVLHGPFVRLLLFSCHPASFPLDLLIGALNWSCFRSWFLTEIALGGIVIRAARAVEFGFLFASFNQKSMGKSRRSVHSWNDLCWRACYLVVCVLCINKSGVWIGGLRIVGFFPSRCWIRFYCISDSFGYPMLWSRGSVAGFYSKKYE